MQQATESYIEGMKQPYRGNRAYARGTIGVISSDAQQNAEVLEAGNNLAYFSSPAKAFENMSVSQIYATAEQDFSRVDGTMYFLQEENSGATFYNNGIVTEELIGSVRITFGEFSPDIRGLTIDFGDAYPTEFTVTNGTVSHTYENDSSSFVTEDVYDESPYLEIAPLSMKYGQNRLRIEKMSFGVVDSFGNDELISCSITEYVSATTESLPSKDIQVVIDNQDGGYNPDNAESALGYLEIGQEVNIAFGYDVDGNGNIEWMPDVKSYLKSWSSTDSEATFVCADLFDQMQGTYYGGLYRDAGISLHDLAVDVLTDYGLEPKDYYIDPYLKSVVVNNPLPPVSHPEALQIIANAGRCVLSEDRSGRIHMQSSFIPDISASTNAETVYSHVENILNADAKDAYAVSSQDFSMVNDTMYFLPDTGEYLNTGYISNAVSDSEGNFTTNPVITLSLEAGYVSYGMKMSFRSVYPEEFVVTTYYNGSKVQELTAIPTGLSYQTSTQFNLFDEMKIEFSKGPPNSRIFIDYIGLGEATDYLISRDDIVGTPTATRANKLRDMAIVRNMYSKDAIEEQDIISEELDLSSATLTHTVYFTDPFYDLSAVAEVEVTNADGEKETDTTSITAIITYSTSYMATVSLSGITTQKSCVLKVRGKSYKHETNRYVTHHFNNGMDVEWDNPLVSSEQHAKDLEEWLSSYYLGEVEYQFDWRGDPRTDANDLFYYELKDGSERTIRAYENQLTFNGAWSGKIKARAVVL